MSTVYVVTNPELGWDCVVGVFEEEEVSKEELEEVFSAEQYVIHQRSVEIHTRGWS